MTKGKADTHGERRRGEILDTGLRLWRDDPASVSARRIGKELGITHTAVLHYFGSANVMHDAIARYAVASRDKVVVPMLIAGRHAAVSSLSDAERAGYLAGC